MDRINRKKTNRKKTGKKTVSRPVKWITKIILLFVFAAGLTAAGKMAIKKSGVLSRFVLEDIRVEGFAAADSAEIIEKSGVKMGSILFEMKLDSIKDNILGIARVKNATVSRRLPDGLTIRIKERTPVALINIGEVALVDREGIIMPLVQGSFVDLPVFSGLEIERTETEVVRQLKPESKEKMYQFLDYAENNESIVFSMISQVCFGRSSKIKLVLESCGTIILIDKNRIHEDIVQAEKIMKYYKGNNEEIPAKINLFYEKLAYVE